MKLFRFFGVLGLLSFFLFPRFSYAFSDLIQTRNVLHAKVTDLQNQYKQSLENTKYQISQSAHDIIYNQEITQNLLFEENQRKELEKRLDILRQRLLFIQNNTYTDYALRLSVPFYAQEKKLSCEIATLRMALGYYNIHVLEADLEKKLPFVDMKEYTDGVWGDPQEGFVGDINGNQGEKTGYGVYWKPIMEIAKEYKPDSYYFENAGLDLIVSELLSGHPVIAWSVYGNNGVIDDISWKTPEGKEIKAYNGEHTFVILGFEGSLAHPKNFIVANPLSQVKRVPVSTFSKRWALLGYSGVVVK